MCDQRGMPTSAGSILCVTTARRLSPILLLKSSPRKSRLPRLQLPLRSGSCTQTSGVPDLLFRRSKTNAKRCQRSARLPGAAFRHATGLSATRTSVLTPTESSWICWAKLQRSSALLRTSSSSTSPSRRAISGLYWGNIGRMEKKMETRL